jgi:hypothetical protein
MSLRELFATIRKRGRRSASQYTEEEGTQITKRLQELLAVPLPKQEVETHSTDAGIKNDLTCHREGRLHWSWSEQGSYVGYPASDRREV